MGKKEAFWLLLLVVILVIAQITGTLGSVVSHLTQF